MFYDDKTSDSYFAALEDCLMVDSLGIRVPGVDVSKLPRKFMEFQGGDNTKWAKGTLHGEDGKVTLKARGQKKTGTMEIHGSPSFHFQEHNVVSSADPIMLQFAAIQAAHRRWGVVTRTQAREIAHGRNTFCTRVDLPLLLKTPPGMPRAALINGLALAGVLAGQNTSLFVGESVYFDKGSQLAALKFYDKVAQMNSRRRRVLPDVSSSSKLEELAASTVRMEGVFRLKYLIQRFGSAPEFAVLTRSELAAMFRDLLDQYDLRRKIRKPLSEEQLMAIPKFRHVVLYWQHGYDVLKMLNGNRAEYSRAKSYLKRHSIHIDELPPRALDEEIELGDVLRPDNFVAIPETIRKDPALFFELNMQEELAKLG